jgi:hypothetical protein
MTIAIERRSSRRDPTVLNAAIVAFKRRGKLRVAGATLVDISSTGALLFMREKPGLNRAIAIRLEYPVRTRPMSGTVVRLTEGGDVGVEFVRGCNRMFYWTATRGEDFHPGRPARIAEAVARLWG